MRAILAITIVGAFSLSSGVTFAQTSCVKQVADARATLKDDPDDLTALHTIELCTRNMQLKGEYSGKAKEVLQNSKILSVVPQLPEMAQVKDLIPVIREVETKQTKTVADYLTLQALYKKLGQPEAQIRALEQAAALDPFDPRPKLILAEQHFRSGDAAEARRLYRDYLTSPLRTKGNPYFDAYIMAMAYPLPVVSTLTAVIWLLGYFLIRRRADAFMATSFSQGRWSRRLFGVLCALLPVTLGLQFASTGHALPFGVLLLIAFGELLALTRPWIVRFLRPVFKLVTNATTSLFGVRFARLMAAVPTGWRVLIAIASLFLVGTIAPTITIPDVRYSVMVVGCLLFFGTVGSLVVSFIRASVSLRSSLRWIGLASTLPFLVVYLVSQWNEIGVPIMQARLPSEQAQDLLFDYLIMWGICALLAIHLGKILADALVTPVREMMWKVTVIEQGNFDARVEVSSRDEIGALGEAVNRMAIGLARRDYVERTFRRYVDKQVAERILSGNDAEVHISGQKMQAVVLFADIRGFTSMSERMAPEQVVGLLNEYFERVVSIIRAHGGVIDKFIGDAILAVWGVPTPALRGEHNAVEAALRIQEDVAEFNALMREKGATEIAVGIGINAGQVVAGSIGSRDRMEYTVIGDVVNTAQRAEGMATAFQVLVTDSVYDSVKSDVAAIAMEDRRVKGKSAPIRLWSVTRPAVDAQAQKSA